MATFTEDSIVSQFTIRNDGNIEIRKTNRVLKDGVVISEQYWRTVLAPNDPQATTVLAGYPDFLASAQAFWLAMDNGNA